MNPLLKNIFTEAAKIIAAANEKNIRIATAESCTGGLIGAALTAISGSSSCFDGGIIAYSNDVKIKQLNVPADMIETHGAVSETVVCAMAKGARDALGVDLAISVTGIAGPSGGSPQKPVGTVWVGIATKDAVTAQLFKFGDIGRNKVRDHTCLEALKIMSLYVKS